MPLRGTGLLLSCSRSTSLDSAIETQRGEKVNAWTCAPRSTDHDPALDKNLDHL